MTTSTSLLDFIMSLLNDPEARAAFEDDAQGYLASCGLGDLSPADVHEALVLVSEDSQDGDFSRRYDTGDNQVHLPPPPAAPHPAPGESHHEAAVKYLNNYVTNTYIDDRDTIVDNSVNQQIDNRGGTFDQDLDIDNVVAAGEGSVAAGEDIEDSNIVTGDGNAVGDGSVFGDNNVVGEDNEVVNGDGNTTAFGEGDANSAKFEDVNVSEGGALSVGGDAEGDNDVDDSFNTDTTSTTTTTTNTDSFNESTSTNTDSFNTDDSENNFASKNDVDVEVNSNNESDVDLAP